MIEVEMHEGADPVVCGNSCARGAEYAIAETTRPERTLTMTIPVAGCLEPLSVKTALPIPKDKIPAAIKEIARLQLSAPITIGETVLCDICGLDVNVLATKSIP